LYVAWINRMFVDCFGLFHHMVLTVTEFTIMILLLHHCVEATGIYDGI